MLLTIERVALLKSIDIFAETPDHILASVARIIEEVELVPGENLIQEGEPGDCLYLTPPLRYFSRRNFPEIRQRITAKN